MKKTDIAKEYRAKYGTEMSTLKLARIMYNENKLLFTGVEHARGKLRYIEGKSGVQNKQYVKNSDFVVKEARPYNPYKLPASDETNYSPFILKANKVLLLNDIHLPYHSVEALTATFHFAKKEKPDCILLNGDLLDFHGLSKFVRDPRKRHFSEELKMFKEFFQILQKTFNARIIFKLGNHEERYQHFLFMKAKELVGVDEFELENIIKARAEGIEVVKDKKIIKFNDLNIIHGHEFASGFFSPVNVARGLYLRGKRSAIQGHNHQTSEHTEPDMDSKITTTWSVGCLCELHPEYMPINKWNSGFAILEAAGDGYEVRNKRIYKGKIL